MAEPDQDTVQDIVSQRRDLLASQPPEPTQTVDASSGVSRQKNSSYPRNPQGDAGLNLAPTPELKQYAAPLPQQDQFSSPFEVFKDPMIVLAGLSSLFTRRPLVSAMNYAGSAMKGYHQGQKDVFQQNKEKFDEALEATLAQNRAELNRYQAAWDWKKDQDWQGAAHKLYAEAAANKDELLMAAIQSGNPDAAVKVLEGRERSKDRIEEAKVIAGLGLKGGPQALVLHRFLEEHPDASAEQIQAFLQGGRSGRSAIGMFVNKYIQEHPDATSDDIKGAVQRYSTQTTAINRFMSGTQGNTIRSLNVVVGHLQTLQEMTDALKNGNVLRFNQLAQGWARETGNPAPTNFETASKIVGTEIIKALGVAGAGTESERTDASGGFNVARGPDAIYGSIGVVRKLLLSQLKGLKQQFTASAGYGQSKEEKEALGPAFDDMLMPETRAFFAETGGGGAGKAEYPTAPSSPAQREKNSVYMTPKGPLKWTGTGWITP